MFLLGEILAEAKDAPARKPAQKARSPAGAGYQLRRKGTDRLRADKKGGRIIKPHRLGSRAAIPTHNPNPCRKPLFASPLCTGGLEIME